MGAVLVTVEMLNVGSMTAAAGLWRQGDEEPERVVRLPVPSIWRWLKRRDWIRRGSGIAGGGASSASSAGSIGPAGDGGPCRPARR